MVETIERLIAAIAAVLMADTPVAGSRALVFTLEEIVVCGFDCICVVVVLQVWSDGNRCWGQNCWLHSYIGDKDG